MIFYDHLGYRVDISSGNPELDKAFDGIEMVIEEVCDHE